MNDTPVQTSPAPPDALATLQALSRADQREILEWLNALPFEEIRGRIREKHGLDATPELLRAFELWSLAVMPLEFAAAYADTLAGRLKSQGGSVDPEQIALAAQTAFELEAIRQQNAAAFINLRKLRQRDRALDLTERRLDMARAQSPDDGAADAPALDPARRETILDEVDEILGM